MAPNIKETAAVIDSLATLNVNDLVHGKFLPLTQEVNVEEASSETNNQAFAPVTQKDTIVTATSDKEQVIADILKDEENRELFTINHVQETLVQGEAKNEDSAEGRVERDSANNDDDYWDMPGPTADEIVAEEQKLQQAESKSDSAAKVNGDLYCLWRTTHQEQKRQEVLRSIVEDEAHRQLFSINSIEASLIVDAKRRSASEHVPHPETDSYWLWEMEA